MTVFCLQTVTQKFNAAGGFRDLFNDLVYQQLMYCSEEVQFTISEYINSQKKKQIPVHRKSSCSS